MNPAIFTLLKWEKEIEMREQNHNLQGGGAGLNAAPATGRASGRPAAGWLSWILGGRARAARECAPEPCR